VRGDQVGTVVPKRRADGTLPARIQIAVPLASGRNEVRVVAENETGEASRTLVVAQAGPGRLDQKGALRILAIGVDDYQAAGSALKSLEFAGKDAKEFESTFKTRIGPGHSGVHARLLVNAPDGESPTASAIRQALDWLREAEENDTVVLFMAGHGVNDQGNYRFLPMDAEKGAKGWSSDKSVSWYALEEALLSAKGRRLMFLDTCRAGNAYNERLANSAYHANIIVYSSARWDQNALERRDLGHGLFTYALIEGLSGRAHRDGRSRISTRSLHDYVVGRVKGLAGEQGRIQEPQYFKGRDAEDYDLTQPDGSP
jgi:uncharacterized caspase-like protein